MLLFRPRTSAARPRIRPYASGKVPCPQVSGEICATIKIRRGNRPLEGNARQAGAIVERRIADTRHAVGYRDTRQAAATVERHSADTRTAGYYYGF